MEKFEKQLQEFKKLVNQLTKEWKENNKKEEEILVFYDQKDYYYFKGSEDAAIKQLVEEYQIAESIQELEELIEEGTYYLYPATVEKLEDIKDEQQQ